MVQPIKQTEPRGWFDLFLAHHGWLAMIAATGMFALTLVSVNQYRIASAFVDHGEKIMAEVVDREVRSGDDRDSYFLTFRFSPPGSTYGIKHKVGESYFDRHPLGAMTEIYYLPSQPHRIQTRAFEVHGDAVLSQVMAAISGIVGCAILVFSGSRANSAIRARRYGTREAVPVIRIDVVRNQDGKPTNQRRLIWRDSRGRFGKSLKHDALDLAHWAPGTEIHIYRGPQRSWWEGDTGPRQDVPRHVPRVKT